MLNIQKMMKQAQDMQFKLQELQEKFKDIDVTGEAGGGAIKVTMTCAGEVTSLSIDPTLIDPANKEVLEDMIIAAFNTAGTAKDERIQEETKGIMAGMGLPEDMKLPPR